MKKRCIAFISAIAAALCLGAFVSCGEKTSNDNSSKQVCSHEYSESKVGLPAGCTYAGYSYDVCEKCGDKNYTVLPPLGHDWDNGTVVMQATCVQSGYMYYTCQTCGETKSQIIDETGEHSFKDGVCKHCGMKYAVYVDEYYNDDYGYRYLATMSKGEDLCAFYDDIAEAVITFHSDGSDAQYDGKKYVLCNIDYVKHGLEMDEAVAVWKTYLDDNPLYYWVSKETTISPVYGLALAVVDEYADGAARTECNTELYGAIEQYVALASGGNDYTVALAFHDKIIEAIDYANDKNNKPESAAWAHNITGVLQGKGAVCEGYARTFQLLLNVCGINNVFVTGKGITDDHAWNLVEIDGVWFWFDLTYDDTPDYYWGISHNYFCATDESFLKNHTPDNGVGLEFLCELPTRAQSRYNGNDAVFYDTFTHDGAEYAVVGYDTLSLSSITKSGDFVIPSAVTYRGREYSVVSIMNYENGEQTIQDVSGSATTSVHISATVRYIDDGDVLNHFSGNIESITVDENNRYFSAQDGVLFSKEKFMLITYPTGKKSVEYKIPDETGVIAYHAFSTYTKNLEKLTIGKNVSMTGWANWGLGYPDELRTGNIIAGGWKTIIKALTGARQILIDEQNPHFVFEDNMLFDKSFTYLYAALLNIQTAAIPETVVGIEYDAFSDCDKLVSVKLPDELTVLPSSIFLGCTSLREIILPNTLTEIDDFAFCGCSSLKSIEIPVSVQIIKRHAFDSCTSLERIGLPEGLIYLDYNAFDRCDKLKEVVVPKNVQYVGTDDKIMTPLPPLYYYGTAEEWEAVDGEFTYYEFSNHVIYTVNVYFYSEEQQTTEGYYWHYVDGAPVAW